LAILGLAVANIQPAIAQEGAEFFKGKTVRLIVGYATGGGYDSYARLLTRYLGKYIPGNPDVIVVDLPGAESLKSVQYLETAPNDGTHLTMFNSGLIMSSLTTPELVKVRFTDYTWIGTMSRDVRVCYIWNKTGNPGSLDEMRKLDQFVFGQTGTGTTAYIEQRLIGEMFGVKVRQVRGYPGSVVVRFGRDLGPGMDDKARSPSIWSMTRRRKFF
jgi:tripartite-type tricarboxylate transporter receptor subunit TctC